jgi:hypothetical protein
LLGNVRTDRKFELEKKEQTYTIEGKKYERDENRQIMKVRIGKKRREK